VAFVALVFFVVALEVVVFVISARVERATHTSLEINVKNASKRIIH
jgi:hypothetical protein